MLSLKDALMWRGKNLSEELSSWKGISPRLQQEANTRVPRGWRACKAGGVCSKQTGSGFLVWQLPEPILHKTVTRTLFLVNTERKRQPGRAWCSSEGSEGSWKPHLPCLSSLKLAPQDIWYKLRFLLSCTSRYNGSFLKNQMPVGGNPVSYLFLWVAVDRALPLQRETTFYPNAITHIASLCRRAQRGEKIIPLRTDWGNLTVCIEDPSSLKASLGKNTKTYDH